MVELSVYNEGVYNDGIYNITLSGSSVSVRLDGEGQYMGRADTNALGIANTWTLGFWAYSKPNPEHFSVFSTAAGRGENEISVHSTDVPRTTQLLGSRPSDLRVLIKDADGTSIKEYGWGGFFRDSRWVHVFLQWDGNELAAFNNGFTAVTGTAFVNASGTMSDTPARKIFYGGAVGGAVATFSGSLGHFGMWDTLLGADEMGTVVSGGFDIDLTVPSGNYVSTGSLQHYWKPGEDPGNIGQDFAGSLNLNKLRNMTSDNVGPEVPDVS